jgi:hypothetical protein
MSEHFPAMTGWRLTVRVNKRRVSCIDHSIRRFHATGGVDRRDDAYLTEVMALPK